ncbi:hypothetical protein CEJ42_06345 [Herbaspirillum robiniae]|uniref:Endopeptidase n=1 Tax=Herbaspirillum robiniae TaxID=2014887 RepID=A0A246WTE4_9BURK|nr:hypothetical protein CEJ42_06345 [Herbaspirillum robiniae]
MQIRHTLLAAAVFTAVLAGCNKRDEAPAAPAATPPAASPAAPAATPPTPAPADSGSTAAPAAPSAAPPADSSTPATPPASGDTAGGEKKP